MMGLVNNTDVLEAVGEEGEGEEEQGDVDVAVPVTTGLGDAEVGLLVEATVVAGFVGTEPTDGVVASVAVTMTTGVGDAEVGLLAETIVMAGFVGTEPTGVGASVEVSSDEGSVTIDTEVTGVAVIALEVERRVGAGDGEGISDIRCWEKSTSVLRVVVNNSGKLCSAITASRLVRSSSKDSESVVTGLEEVGRSNKGFVEVRSEIILGNSGTVPVVVSETVVMVPVAAVGVCDAEVRSVGDVVVIGRVLVSGVSCRVDGDSVFPGS